MIPRTIFEINKEIWYNSGDKCLIRNKQNQTVECTVVDCYWNTVVLTEGHYNFCVQKADIYYRLPVIIHD